MSLRALGLLLSALLLLACASAAPPPAADAGGIDAPAGDVGPGTLAVDAPPEAAAPVVWPPVEVFLAPGWEPGQREVVLRALRRLHALGPAFEEARAAGPRAVVLRTFRGAGCFEEVLRFPAPRVVELDLSCMAGEEAQQQAVAHGVGHALGMAHICGEPGELPECSPVGFGLAMMGPRLRPASSGRAEVYSGARGTADPTDLDRAELRRVYSGSPPSPTGPEGPDGGSR